MYNNIKLAIVGLGDIAYYQLKALEFVDEIDVVATCDIDNSKKRKSPKNSHFFQDYKEMLANVDIDAVLISIPNEHHFEVARYALKSNHNVLLEKPATTDLDEFRELIDISEEKNNNFLVAFHAAFAKDLLWFLKEYKNNLKKELGVITGFSCNFYDPYIRNGKLLEHSEKLGGSWIDSGINALSVIGRLIDGLKIEDSILTQLPQYNCREIQGTVNFTFKTEDNNIGRGTIDTNWALDLDCKITRLFFYNSNKKVILHHSKQKVILEAYENKKVLKDFSGTRERLVNHYIGVFEDFYKSMNNDDNNLEYAWNLHRLLLSVYDSKEGLSECR